MNLPHFMEKSRILLGVFVLIAVFMLGFLFARADFGILGRVIDSDAANESNLPADYLKEEDFLVYSNKVILQVENAKITNYESESMLPFLGKGANGIVVEVESAEDVNVGDVITFRRGDTLVVHRVIEKGVDEEGIYFITKGDNVDIVDGKIRFESIEHKLIGIIY